MDYDGRGRRRDHRVATHECDEAHHSAERRGHQTHGDTPISWVSTDASPSLIAAGTAAYSLG